MLSTEQKKEMFPNYRDLSMKINGTITWYKDQFYYTECTESMKIHLFPLNWRSSKRNVEKIITCPDNENWNIKFPKLGYINNGKVCTYLSRAPARTNKIAPSLNGFSAWSPDGRKSRFSLRDAPDITHEELNEYFNGRSEVDFPTAIKLLAEPSQESVALSPDFCLYKDSMSVTKAVYKNTVVGWLAKTKKPRILIPEAHAKHKRITLISKFLNMDVEVLKDV